MWICHNSWVPELLSVSRNTRWRTETAGGSSHAKMKSGDLVAEPGTAGGASGPCGPLGGSGPLLLQDYLAALSVKEQGAPGLS